jgi:pimeloyl-ACP methyl ester carboxylesterase
MLFQLLRLPLLVGSLSVLAACGSTPSARNAMPSPGQVVNVQAQTRSLLTESSQRWMVSYITTSHSGQSTVVQGLIDLPKTPPPAGGYPVVSWGTGTTGVAPQCAPSLAASPSRLEYQNLLLKQGYAVLRTDYEGWGAFAGRPDLEGRSNAYAMADLVTAAHALPIQLSKEWIAAGHSQGGGAVIWVASMKERTPAYPLKAAVALAPTGPGVLKFLNDVVDGQPVSAGAQPFVAITALATKVADPSLDLDKLTHPAMKPQIEAAKTTCIGGLFGMPVLAPGQYLKKGPEFDKMVKFFAAQDPTQLKLQVPVFIAQGEKDQTTVTPPTTRQMMGALCGKGARIQYKEYAGEDHGSVIMASSADSLRFISSVLSNQTPANDCR